MNDEAADECAILESIFGSDFQFLVNSLYHISISRKEGAINYILYILFPHDYPHLSPPIFEITHDSNSIIDIDELSSRLHQLWDSKRESIIFDFTVYLEENLVTLLQEREKTNEFNEEERTPDASSHGEDGERDSPSPISTPLDSLVNIESSVIIKDRGSIFQAFLSEVTSESDVARFRRQLLTVNKIQRATHNIMVI